jgi:magnesium chelatase family protein
MREARDRIRAAIVNSGEQWPTGKITIRLSPASSERTSSLDLAIAVAILAAAEDVPDNQLASTLFRAELGLDGRLRPTVGIDELLAAATRDELPAIQEDDALVLVVPTHDAPAAMETISQSRVPYVRVVGARHLRDVIAWLRGEARLDLTLAENQPE